MSAVAFLASLAPAGLPGPDASYVRAARPPLFAAGEDEALSEVSPGANGPDLEETTPESQPRRRVQELPAPSGSLSGHATAARHAGAARPVQSRVAGHAVGETRTAPAITPGGAKPRGAARTAASKPRQTAAVEPLQSASTHPAISGPVSVVVQRSLLRDELRAQRQVTEPPSAAPIVHVTIDRIDVRAPAATQPASPPPKARRAASQSLMDYLRQANPSGSDTLK